MHALPRSYPSITDVELDSEYSATIGSMSVPLQSFQDPRKIESSKEAFHRLLRADVIIPRSIVSAFEAETKIKGALKETKVMRHEEAFNSGRLVGRMMKAYRETRVSAIYGVSNDDLPSTYRCQWVDDVAITPSLAGRIIQEQNIELSADARPGTIAHVMLSYCGSRMGISHHEDPFLHKLQRGFKDFIKGM